MVKNSLATLLSSEPGRQAMAFTGHVLRRLDDERPNQLLVLTYHAVKDRTLFESHMSFLAGHYQAVRLNDVLDALTSDDPQKALPPRALLVTFDDAYRSFSDCAWPIMQRNGLPATLFVATAFPDAPDNVFWWDRLEDALMRTQRRDVLASPAGVFPLATDAQRRAALRQLKQYLWRLPPTELLGWVYELCARLGVTATRSRVLSWSELRRLKQEGVTLAPHSQTHPNMSRLSRQEAQCEIAGSLADLERETGPAPPVFAYPGGHYNRETVAALAQEKFLMAFATLRGANDLMKAREGTNRFELRRNHIGETATLATLQTRLVYASRFLNRWHYARKYKKGYES